MTATPKFKEFRPSFPKRSLTATRIFGPLVMALLFSALPTAAQVPVPTRSPAPTPTPDVRRDRPTPKPTCDDRLFISNLDCGNLKTISANSGEIYTYTPKYIQTRRGFCPTTVKVLINGRRGSVPNLGCKTCGCEASSNIFANKCKLTVSGNQETLTVKQTTGNRVFFNVKVCSISRQTKCKTYTCKICVKSGRAMAMKSKMKMKMMMKPMQRRVTVSGGVRKLARSKVFGDEGTRSKRHNIRALADATKGPTDPVRLGSAPGLCTCPSDFQSKALAKKPLGFKC